MKCGRRSTLFAKTRRSAHAWMFVCLMALLSGCNPAPMQTRVDRQYPPAYLLLDCRRPAVDAERLGDLIDMIPALYRAIDDCSAEKATLRDWAAGK